MKSFEEYSESVYKKRDGILKQRKRRIRAAVAVTACAAVIIPSAISAASRINTQESVVDTAATVNPTEEYHYLLECVPNELCTEIAAEQAPEIATEAAGDAEAKDPDSDSLPEAVPGGVKPENGNAHLDGALPDMYISTTQQGDTDDYKDAASDNKNRAEYSQEEIISAAFESLTDEEKASVKKGDAMVNIEHHASGEENYVVMFAKADGGYIKVKLDAETLEIRS